MILAQETIWGRKSPSKVAVYLRVFSRDALRLGMLCLGWWAGKSFRAMAAGGTGDFQSRQRFIRKNAQLQRELGRFYTPYHQLCPACDGCCHHPQTPYWQLDILLYGLPPALNRPWMDLPFSQVLLELGYYLVVYLAFALRLVGIGHPKSADPELPREAGISECLGVNGCQIPYGRRPANCVFLACSPFLQNMDWGEYRRYLRLSLKYLRLLAVSLLAVVAEGRQPVRG